MDTTRVRQAPGQPARRRCQGRRAAVHWVRRASAALRAALSALVPCAAVGMVVYLIVTRGHSFGSAFAAVSPWVLVAAVGAHLLTLALRTEAWSTVLRASGGERLSPHALHAANAGAFLAGTLQGQAAMPTRVALLRRFGGSGAPTVAEAALCDAPIVIFEACASAILAAFGSTAAGLIPAWTPWALLGGSLVMLMILRVLYDRLRGHKLAAGLAVLADPRLRIRLAIIVTAFTLMAFLRTLIVMWGFGLPTDPAHVCLVLFTMGAVGLLPLGVGTGPAAMVTALGAGTLVSATAAGMVVSAATIIAVLIYTGAVWAWRIAANQPRPPAPAMA